MNSQYDSLLDIAYNLHVSGKLEDAEAAYKKLLSIKSDDINVLNLYAQLNVTLKNYASALELFGEVYEKIKSDSVLLNIAKIYFYKNEYDNVISTLRKLKENNEETVRLYALAYLKSGNKERAIANYKALADNNSADAADLYNLSFLYDSTDNIDEALKYALMSYEKNPDDTDINKFLAGLYKKQDDENNELIYLLNVSEKYTDTDTLYRIGCIYVHLNECDKAIEYFNKAQNTAKDDDIRSLLYMGIIYQQHDLKKAAKIFEQAYNKSCGSDSGGDYIKNRLAYIYSATNRIDDAYKMLDAVSDRESVEEDYLLMKLREKKLEEVREDFYKFANEPLSEEKCEKRIRSMFQRMDMEKQSGMPEESFVAFEMEMAKKCKQEQETEIKRLKTWKDQDLTGKRLLVYSDNGVGDMFMFSRYLCSAAALAKEVILQIPSSCFELYKYNFPDFRIEKMSVKIPPEDYDYSVTFVALMYGLNVSLKNIPFSRGYLRVSDKATKEKSEFYFMNTNKKKIGIYWQGNPYILASRAIKLRYLKPLFDLTDFQIYSFQMSTVDAASDKLKSKLPLIDLAPHIKNYEDTAAFLKNIDVLVTIDTSIANLAGAMGIKTYLMLPYLPEWRWFRDTDKTPWYDSVKIFKQKILGDWTEVVERIKNEFSV